MIFLSAAHVFHADYRSVSFDMQWREMNLYRATIILDWGGTGAISLICLQSSLRLGIESLVSSF